MSDRTPARLRKLPARRPSVAVPGYARAALSVAVVLFIANAVASTSFLSEENWAPTVGGAGVIVILSMAQAVAVISGRAGVDLSVGPLAGFVNAIVVVKLVGAGVTTPFLVIPAALAVGAAVGLLNGFLVAVIRLPAIVATLGTYLALGGLTLDVMPQAGGSAPGWLTGVAGSAGPIPGILFVIAGVGVAWVLLMRTAFRRNLFATGSDERTAYTAGVNVTAVRILAYVVSGTIAAVGGLVLTAVLGSGDPNAASNYTIQSIAAVALGGVALAGGRGGILGAGLGGAVLFLIQNLLTLAHVDIYRLQIVYGVVVLLAVAANSLLNRSRSAPGQALTTRDQAMAALARLRLVSPAAGNPHQ